MENCNDSVGQATFIRTDTMTYAETTILFHSLEEMVELCTSSPPNLSLNKLVVFHYGEKAAKSITLDFISCSNVVNRKLMASPTA
jgi:hypothetical protein